MIHETSGISLASDFGIRKLEETLLKSKLQFNIGGQLLSCLVKMYSFIAYIKHVFLVMRNANVHYFEMEN